MDTCCFILREFLFAKTKDKGGEAHMLQDFLSLCGSSFLCRQRELRVVRLTFCRMLGDGTFLLYYRGDGYYKGQVALHFLFFETSLLYILIHIFT
ncbi:hypothetical protein Scep_012763 [Stephania cephalantha]|uniref:Uncharacterized protein n=1 Tax=Stephania cephalantha TaxID=152367 RepID=A0AAP0JGK3_9MAGN